MWNFEYVQEVQKALEEIGRVCPRCVLRLGGVKNSREHKAAEDIEAVSSNGQHVSEVNNGNTPPAKKPRLETFEVCRACLGVLQESLMQPTLEMVCRDVRNSGYDADHFTIAVSLPVSLSLRSHSLNLYLEEKVPHFDPDQVVPIKQVWKWLFPYRIEESVGKKHVGGDSCEFYAELQFDFVDEEKDANALQKMCADEYEMRAKKHRKYHMGLVTRQGAEKSLSEVSEKQFRANFSVPPTLPDQPVEGKVKMYHNSIFFAGRYNKYSRELPQTPWLVDGVRKMETSVEELITDSLNPAFTFDSARFSASGREDVDVRTLGLGRPFLLEIVNPRKVFFSPHELKEIEDRINSKTDKIKIGYLAVIPKQNVKILKDGEDQKKKSYLALCISPTLECPDLQNLNAIKNVELQQKTPIRVLHRRPNATRNRTVYEMSAEPVSIDQLRHFDLNSSVDSPSRLFRLKLTTQAGTYVKEFVHGDFGRTSPNLREILQIPDLDIIALDVMSIDLEWPPGVIDKGQL